MADPGSNVPIPKQTGVADKSLRKQFESDVGTGIVFQILCDLLYFMKAVLICVCVQSEILETQFWMVLKVFFTFSHSLAHSKFVLRAYMSN